jgi:hypothetical protein
MYKRSLKSRWIQALNSGEYIQGFGELKSFDNKYCPIGVLLDISTDMHEFCWEEFYYEKNIESQFRCVPILSGCISNIDRNAIRVYYNGRILPIAYINDVYQLPFSEISSIIRTNLCI